MWCILTVVFMISCVCGVLIAYVMVNDKGELVDETHLLSEEQLYQEQKKQIDKYINKFAKKMLREFDSDGNGYLDRDECKKMIERLIQDVQGVESKSDQILVSDEDFDKCFKVFDKNGDGQIQREEIADFIRAVMGIEDTEEEESGHVTGKPIESAFD